MVRKILFVVLVFVPLFANAKYKWERISYYHSTGPVSPEYQYNYTITIDDDGAGRLEFTKAGKTTTYNFRVGDKGIHSLNNALVKSKVLNASPENLKPENELIGGSVYNATVTLHFPDEEEGESEKEKPPIIIIPNNVNKKYSDGVFALYLTMEKLVPLSTWQQAME